MSRYARAILLPLLILMAGGCRPRSDLLLVTSHPEGAAVWIDGVPVAETPCELVLSSASRILEIKEENYEPWRAVLGTRKPVGMNGELSVDLMPRQSRVLRCESEPPGAAVWIDGEERGCAPVDVVGLRDGTHEVAMIDPQGRRRSSTVELTQSTARLRIVRLRMASGIEEYCRRLLEREPKNLDALVDLLHCLVLDGCLPAVRETTVLGLHLVNSDPRVDGSRFWHEVHRAATGQFRHGRTSEDRHDVASALRQALGDVAPDIGLLSPENAAAWVRALDLLRLRPESRKLLSTAFDRWPEHPDLKSLAAAAK